MAFHPPKKFHIRVGAEPGVVDPAEQQQPEEEPKKEEEQPKVPTSAKELLAKLQETGAAGIAYGVAVGLAVTLRKLGVEDKKQLSVLKIQEVARLFPQLLKLALQERQAFAQELRTLWRLGPKQYLYRVGAALRK